MSKSDIPRLQELYKQAPDAYLEPNWATLSGKVLTDDSNRVLLCLASRPTVEVYCLMDREWAETPGLKFANFERLHEAVRRDLAKRGVEDAQIWVKCRSFARKLMKRLHWLPNNAISLSRKVC